MSTYLLAFLVSDFDSISDKNANVSQTHSPNYTLFNTELINSQLNHKKIYVQKVFCIN